MEVYIFPLSHAQKRLWYQEAINSGNSSYNIPIAFRLYGNLNQNVLEQVFQTIINRHEILRTTFATENGEPVQLVHSEMQLNLEHKILANQEDIIQKELALQARQPFDLVKGSLIRGILYQIQPQEHILFINMHHIVSDGWSLGVFLREFTQLYTAYVKGLEFSLPELPIQYGDFAEWQENWLQEDGIKQQLTYWEKALAGLPPVLDLPLDFQRPMQQTFNGATVRTQLPKSLTDSLELLAKQEGATFFMAALAVFQVLLFRYTHQTDIIVGSPIANRKQSELNNLIGFFVNSLPLRGNLSGNPSFREFLHKFSRTCLDAYTNQDVPFEILVDKLEAKRDPSRSPIFQTLFAVQNAPMGEIQLPGVTVTPLYLDNGGAKFDLTLMLEPTSSGWLASLEYNTDLFSHETAQRILKHYHQLLAAAISAPDSCINTLPLLTHSERQELLALGNASQLRAEERKNLVELFVSAARTYPDRIAVKASQKTLTYQELDQRSDSLANFLRSKGVRSEVRVGIFQERSEALIVSLLAVLKAGGTYVPLDPAYPEERISYILEDSGISLVLTETAVLSSLPLTETEVVIVDTIEFSSDEKQTSFFEILPNQAAYIIYTSGSTGKPKGCVVTHGNVTRLMSSTEAWYGFNENDVWTLFHSFAFDFSVWEIWGALLYGGKLVVVSYLESRSPEAFYELLMSEGVTILNQTPSAFRQLIRADIEAKGKLGLRGVIFGGEALELQSLRPWFERYGSECPRLINMYGITETTVHVTYRPITLEDVEQNRGSVIGVPIPDLSLYVLDEALEPVPIGVPGEIYVGGMGVSRGYLNRAKLTAERFIPDPFSNQPGARLYRSGDLARRLNNGDLEYLGRGDQQVKVRGFRIELGEIEAALAALPELAEAVVVVNHGENTEDKRLVAYIVPIGEAPNRSYLRGALKERLPDYMIPAAFVFLDIIPLTAQGKVNRKELPAPDWSFSADTRTIQPPQTPAQKVVCEVWESILGINAVGIEDNFFELGGDSILALRVVTQMRRQGWLVTPKDIFQQQTVKALANVAQIQSTALIYEKAHGEAPLTPIQRWFFELDLSNPHHWNQAVLLEVNKSLNPQIFADAVRAVASHHDIFRLRFQLEDGFWRQFYSENDGIIAFEAVDLACSNETEQDTAMQEVFARSQKSLDLNNGILARVILFKLGDKRPDRLLIVLHHLIVDGVSWRILLEDLACAIINLDEGKSVELLATTTSYKEWSEFLQHYQAQSSAIELEKQFWFNSLKDDTFALPLDFPEQREKNLESSVKTFSLTFTKDETSNLLVNANKAFHTQPQELLLAALAKTFSSITNQDTLPIIMEGHGREELSKDLDLTRSLGWFTTLYPLCLNAASNAVDETLIKGVKEQLRSVSRHSWSYGILRYLHFIEELGESLPQTNAQISFNYLGQVRNETGDDRLFRLLNEDKGLLHDPNGLRPHLIDIIAIVVEGELRIDWLYSENLHSGQTITQWANDFRANLLKIFAYCTEAGVGGYSPSDFPLVCINQASLDILEAKYPNLEDIYPLSPLQEGMLFHTLYSPDDGVYFEQVTGKITGKFDIAIFASAWQSVVDRHPILRSAYQWENQDSPLQVVSRDVKFPIQQKDWRNFTPKEQEEQLQEYLIQDRKKGFHLDLAPLMRFVIIHLSESTWQWVWSHHHLLLDGWSLPVIFKEVLEIYQANLQGISSSLAPVPAYKNYIQWLAERNHEQAKQFWQETLAGISHPSRCAFKLPNQTELFSVEADYQEEELHLEQEEFASLQLMAQNYHVTLNTLAQAAWALLLHKYGAGDDVLFGVTVSGRPPELPEVENMVGLFINTLPMRVRLQPEVTVASWLKNIQQLQVQIREYEYSKLVDIKNIIAFPPGEDMFESILVFENYPVNESLKNQSKDIQVDDIRFNERTNYPLTIAFIPQDGLILKLNYETKFLSPSLAKMMLQHLRNLLLELACNPEQPSGEIKLLSAQESNLAINEWNANSTSWGDFLTAHQLFEEQAQANPDAVALVMGENSLTYGELEKRANSLAALLKAEGISHELIVGLYFEPSIEYIVALLAVLKAGGAFLPLDPAYPQERLSYILEDSKACLIVTQDKQAPTFFKSHHKVISFPELEQKAQSFPSSVFLSLPSSPSHLAYVIYTSGSTGKPKGVLVTHAGIQNLVRAQATTFGVTKQSRVYQFASLSFDASVSEIFMALGSGASLYLRDQAERLPDATLWEALTAGQITHLTLAPSLLAAIVPENLPNIETLIVAGEAAAGNLLRRWGGGYRQIFNAYGPTEATVCASMMDCSYLVGEPSIGRAMSNVEMYLLDSNLELVAPGVPGEIYIGGIGLARGYLHQSRLTASAFVPHPFAKQPGARLYRTGDIGVYDTIGNIYYLGRQDNRVKFHGYRIELGEIEAALASHEAVESTIVLLREDIPGRPRLVAYALMPTEKATSEELLEHSAKILPSYMVPSTVVLVKEWPLTPNGKINRKALPAPELPSHKETEENTATNATEEILGKIWAEVLGLEAVHLNDNFFEMGGDSIISLQIVSRSRDAGLSISPKDIFEAQTLGRLAQKAKSLSTKVEVVEPLTGKVPLAPIQHWFFEQNLTHPNQWNQALALSINKPSNEPLDINALTIALESVVAHHDVLRLQFHKNQQGVWEQSYAGSAAKPPLRVENFSSYLPYLQRYVLQVILEEEQKSFDFNRPPLLRALYAKNLEQYGDVLFLFGHHLVVDGVSWRILVEDLNIAYQQVTAGKPVSLSTKTTSYRQWTTALETLVDSPEIAQDILFWQETLSTPTAVLPVDYEMQPASNTVDSLSVETTQLTTAETLTLLKEATAIYHAGVQEILLASLLETISNWSNSSNLLVDLEGHGREDIFSKEGILNGLDLSRTVGWFTSLYPVLLKKPEENTIGITSAQPIMKIASSPTSSFESEAGNLLKEIKKQIRAIPHHGLSFGLIRYLAKDEAKSETLAAQKAQISFNYLGQIDNQLHSNSLFSLSNAPTGSGMFGQQQRPHLLAVNARVQGENLVVDWSYSKNIHSSETIRQLAESFLNNLRAYLVDSNKSEASFYSVTDFSLVGMSEKELDSLLKDLEDDE
jgi:amino acid adenylation domain-containing protein/non-ribosomal peptide synthase protein (TIGR01720 family)